MKAFTAICFGFLLATVLRTGYSQEVVVTYLSWFQPYGTTVGCNQWRAAGSNYEGRRRAGLNFPNRSEKIKPRGEILPLTFGLSQAGRDYIRSELELIKLAGFDVIAYDMLPDPNPKYPSFANAAYCGLDLFERYGDIAGELGLKLTLFSDIKNRSSDYPRTYTFTNEEWLSAYTTIGRMYGDKSWFWKPRGVPAIFQFGATVGAMAGKSGNEAIKGWDSLANELSQRRMPLDIFLDIRPSDEIRLFTQQRSGSMIPFVFAPGAPYGFLNRYLTSLSNRSPFLTWSVSPGYYNRSLMAHLPPDFARIHKSYMQAIKEKAKVLMVTTWNDLEEDTDIMPSQTKGMALASIFGFYNKWYKSGVQPSIERSTLIIALPQRQFANIKSGPPSWGDGIAEGEGTMQGKIAYYWALLKDDGWLDINGTRIGLPAGLSFGTHQFGSVTSVQVLTSFNARGFSQIEAAAQEGEREADPGRTYRYLTLEE
jgi:hypothetical protein